MKKRIMAIAMLVVMIVSCIPINASAAVTVTPKDNKNWTSSVTCTLKKTKKDAYVTVKMSNYGVNCDIRMLSGGKVIWSESNSIKSSSSNKSTGVYRVYKLGKGKSSYQLQFKGSKKVYVYPPITVKPSTGDEIYNYMGLSRFTSANCTVK
ncbi:MAG: hypothetical protein LIO62_04875 [Clostridiales bacterium]|nr:hypothetical protein [Clostridiales bacterium]